MIFVTVGTQVPFDRLIKMLDELAPEIDDEIIAQTFKGKYEVKNIKTVGFLPPDEFDKIFAKARIVVAHAGMGTIISALRLNKPIIVMPRVASWGEHRNNHQISTAMKLQELGYVYAAYDKKQLREYILRKDLAPLSSISEMASPKLLDSIRDFVG